LDEEPGLLFRLRGVDAEELIAQAGEGAAPAAVGKGVGADRILDASKLTDVFGIDLVEFAVPGAVDTAGAAGKRSGRRTAKKTASKSRTSKRERATRGGRAKL
jgi:uncharacterized Zn finger protein